MSDKREHMMDQLFRDKLRNMEAEPAFHNWEMISEALPEEPSFYRRYVKELSIAAMMLLALGTTLFWAAGNLNTPGYGPAMAYIQTDNNMYLDPYMVDMYELEQNSSNMNLNAAGTVLASTSGSNPVSTYAQPEPVVIIQQVPADLPSGSMLVSKEEYSNLKGLLASVSELQSFYNKYKDILTDPFNSKPEYPEMRTADTGVLASAEQPASGPISRSAGEVEALDNLASADVIASDDKSLRDVAIESYTDIPTDIMTISAFSPMEDRIAKITGGAANYDFTPQNHHSSRLKGLFVGVGAGVHNSWILNKRAFKANTDVPEYTANYGSSYGVHVGYDFNSRFGVELDWILNSRQGQEFSNIVGQAQPALMSSIQMDYMHLPFLLKYKWSKLSSLTNKPVVMNYGIGVQYSYLKALTTTRTEEFIPVSNIDRSHEIGLALALDYDFYISDKSFITVGGRSSYGTEASEIRNALSSSSSKTNNLLLGVRAAYSRRLSK